MRNAIQRHAVRVRRTLGRILRSAARRQIRVITDIAISVGSASPGPVLYRTDMDKEEISRDYVLNRVPACAHGRKLRFLDVGGRDGRLSYLLGNIDPLEFDREIYAANKARFDSLYEYFGVDLSPAGPNVLHGNLCDRRFLETYGDFAGTFDVIYSNNVFEHLDRPWVAAAVLMSLLKVGGICITIVPFAQRYHESPGDYFRYTHTGIAKLFEAVSPVRVLEAGYDIRARRYDWQGLGDANDIVPADRYGAWRETWITVSVLEKLAEG